MRALKRSRGGLLSPCAGARLARSHVRDGGQVHAYLSARAEMDGHILRRPPRCARQVSVSFSSEPRRQNVGVCMRHFSIYAGRPQQTPAEDVGVCNPALARWCNRSGGGGHRFFPLCGESSFASSPYHFGQARAGRESRLQARDVRSAWSALRRQLRCALTPPWLMAAIMRASAAPAVR